MHRGVYSPNGHRQVCKGLTQESPSIAGKEDKLSKKLGRSNIASQGLLQLGLRVVTTLDIETKPSEGLALEKPVTGRVENLALTGWTGLAIHRWFSVSAVDWTLCCAFRP
jgi:hypothetical protein